MTVLVERVNFFWGVANQMVEHDIFLWALLFVLILLFIMPTVRHFFSGWRYRRDTILNGFNDKAKEAYFTAFHPSLKFCVSEPWPVRFKKYYDERFGWQHFILPLTLLSALVILLVWWSGYSIQSWLQTGRLEDFEKHHLSFFSIIAISGAYLYCLSEQIQRWSMWTFSPGDLYWLSFRFVVAIPIAWVLRAMVPPQFGIPAAFFLAAFPTNTLFAMMRRLLSQMLRVGDVPMSGETELKELSGIDLSSAERFAAQDITTILRLAYYDPVELTMRTNFDYSYIVDCISQALLFIYVGKGYFTKLALHGIRGAYEMRVIACDLQSKDPGVMDRAKEVLKVIAVEIGYPSPHALERVCFESGSDPCTVFIYLSWGWQIDENESAEGPKIESNQR